MTTDLKILILEDNQSDADLIQRELKKNGSNFISKIVQTRQTFEEALQNFSPHIILSDYSLPAFDGLTAFHMAKKAMPHVPFIMISGTLGEERAVEIIKNGITDYVLKDKLFSLNSKIIRALKDAEEVKANKIIAEELKVQHAKLLEIAFLQTHQVRVPVVQILGLYQLFEFDDPSAPINGQILTMLKTTVESLDRIVIEILEKTAEIQYPAKRAS